MHLWRLEYFYRKLTPDVTSLPNRNPYMIEILLYIERIILPILHGIVIIDLHTYQYISYNYSLA